MPRSAWILTASLVLTLAALSVWLKPWRLEPMRPVQPAVQIAQQLDGWKGTDVKTDRTFLGLANFSQILEREYAKGPWRLNAFIGVAGISFHAYSFHTPKTALPTSGWIVEDRSRERRGDRQLDVLLVRRGTKRLLVHHWRQRSGGILRETLRTALALDRSPLRRAELPVVVRLSTPVSGGVAGRKAGEQRLETFSELLLPLLEVWRAPGG
jgi:hypothetical protein